MGKVLQKHRNTKAVIIQAFSYISAFLLGVMPPLLLSVGAIDNSGNSGETSMKISDSLEKISLVFLPLQGFFNFIIFLSFKVYNHRRTNRDVSISRILGLLFCTTSHEPFFISRISIVKRNDGDCEDLEHDGAKDAVGRYGSNMIAVDIYDESNEELQYRLALMNSCSNMNNIPSSAVHDVDEMSPIPECDCSMDGNSNLKHDGGHCYEHDLVSCLSKSSFSRVSSSVGINGNHYEEVTTEKGKSNVYYRETDDF
jgi:hypothetical protein